MYFSRDVFANIVRGSLSIAGIPIESKQFVSKANNLEHQTIFIQRYPNQEAKECLVIQADDLLLQDVKTKRYFRAQRNELEYVVTPEQEGTEVIYALKQQGNAILSYQIHGKCHRGLSPADQEQDPIRHSLFEIYAILQFQFLKVFPGHHNTIWISYLTIVNIHFKPSPKLQMEQNKNTKSIEQNCLAVMYFYKEMLEQDGVVNDPEAEVEA